MTVAVIGSFRIPIERLVEARPMMDRLIAATRAEAGCISYAYAMDLFAPGLIRVSELWESREHLAAHFATEHMALWSEQRAGLGLTERDITVYELGSAEAL